MWFVCRIYLLAHGQSVQEPRRTGKSGEECNAQWDSFTKGADGLLVEQIPVQKGKPHNSLSIHGIVEVKSMPLYKKKVLNMTSEKAGYNAIKMMLYYMPLRYLTKRKYRLAIRLYNVYAFGYPLGVDNKEMLWPDDFPDEVGNKKCEQQHITRIKEGII